ncbi:PREDICTED: zinc finger and BTB domain-containing protein 41-like isoform X9 [Papilio xuthus]|uniref:Zinc finger and BTB domain-containing protein 41-like isoform X9 n=1 Tax=Papilio xuthus TaxID=66420 RepID=A0AAJ6Z258_PAPXU|nr:PREDICTED: zinc finger and BTB domain-containing protein 41-like isoform X9 [Papilio xuthus]
METKGIDGMCRCCASSGIFKDMYATYNWMGEDEIYANMLQYCFDITLSTAEDQNNGGICEVCITQLRNAANFKKQVQQTEVQFKKLLERKEFSPKPVKIEITDMTELMDDAIHSDNEMSDSDAEFSVNIKRESPEPKAKKRAKATSSRADDDTGEPSTKRGRTTGLEIKRKKSFIEISSKSQKTRNSRNGESPIILLKKKNELDQHLDNLKVILINSNATIIRCKNSIGFVCCFCEKQYSDPNDLKQHNLQHEDIFESNYIRNQTMPTLLIKLDITNLCCKICSKRLIDLDELFQHLEEHEINYDINLKSHIVPFKFDSDKLRCVICKYIFNNFKVLLEHMNLHFRNYICNICDTGFVNKRILQTHAYRHKIGIFHCCYCGKEFNNKIKQKAHERAVHICLNKRSRCGYCGESFSDYTKKHEHEVKMHGVKPVVVTCYACEKIFDNQRSLSVHIKTFHLLER